MESVVLTSITLICVLMVQNVDWIDCIWMEFSGPIDKFSVYCTEFEFKMRWRSETFASFWLKKQTEKLRYSEIWLISFRYSYQPSNEQLHNTPWNGKMEKFLLRFRNTRCLFIHYTHFQFFTRHHYLFSLSWAMHGICCYYAFTSFKRCQVDKFLQHTKNMQFFMNDRTLFVR